MSDEYISIDVIPTFSKYLHKNSKIIIHPFVLKDSEIILLRELNSVPSVFKNVSRQKVEEICFRDIYYQNIDNIKDYITIKRTPLDVKSKSFIEVVTEKKISEDCFPILRKYDNVKNYSYYKYKIFDGVYFKLTDINGKKYFSVEIIDINSLTDTNISKICNYLNKIFNECK